MHENYKQMVLKANDIGTVTTGRRFGGNTCRCIKNQFSRNFLQYEYAEDATAESIADLGVGALRKAAVDGNTKEGCFLAGQISGLVNEIKPAKQIIEEMCSSAENILKNAGSFIK